MDLRVFTIFLLIFLSSCQNRVEMEHKLEDSLQNKILNLHDQLMAKMGKMETLQDELKNPHFATNPHYQQKFSDTLSIFKKYQQASANLDSGNQSMMNWMNDFKKDYKAKTHEETMKYLKTNLEKVQFIDSFMDRGLKRAQSLLTPGK